MGLPGFVAPVFWGVIVLSVLVFLHEGGHFLASRLCGVRVTEFFLGLPCRFNLHHASKRIGTKFGVTPLLLGGYAAVTGMDEEVAEGAAAVLGAVHRRGKATVSQIAEDTGLSEEQALDACAFLMTWGSVAPVYDPEKGEREGGKYYPSTYAAMPRDAAGNTVFDGRAFDRAHATAEGEPWKPTMSDEDFLARERSHTYAGKGFWKRAFILVAGILVNILTGIVLLMAVYSVIGVQTYNDVPVLGGVTASSPAEKAGLVAGDTVLSVDGKKVSTWTELQEAIKAAGDDGSVALSYRHDGATKEETITLDDQGMLGIMASSKTVRLPLLDSAGVAFGMIGATASGVAQLLMPQHTVEVLQNSTSIVGISVMSAQAAESGAASLLSFAALISLSLGFMNLLPIPPLDGGKLLIEVIQAVFRRRVPTRVQTYISYVGVALFGLLFVFMLRQDILRFL